MKPFMSVWQNVCAKYTGSMIVRLGDSTSLTACGGARDLAIPLPHYDRNDEKETPNKYSYPSILDTPFKPYSHLIPKEIEIDPPSIETRCHLILGDKTIIDTFVHLNFQQLLPHHTTNHTLSLTTSV